jgi:hypothetical protein
MHLDVTATLFLIYQGSYSHLSSQMRRRIYTLYTAYSTSSLCIWYSFDSVFKQCYGGCFNAIFYFVRSTWFIGSCYIKMLPMYQSIASYQSVQVLPVLLDHACYRVSILGTFHAWYQSTLPSMHSKILLKSINTLSYENSINSDKEQCCTWSTMFWINVQLMLA